MYTHILRRSNIWEKSSSLLLIDSFATKYNTFPMHLDTCRNVITHCSKSLNLSLRRVLYSPYSYLMIYACKKEKRKQNKTKHKQNKTTTTTTTTKKDSEAQEKRGTKQIRHFIILFLHSIKYFKVLIIVFLIDQAWSQDRWVLAKFFFLRFYSTRRQVKNKTTQKQRQPTRTKIPSGRLIVNWKKTRNTKIKSMWY